MVGEKDDFNYPSTFFPATGDKTAKYAQVYSISRQYLVIQPHMSRTVRVLIVDDKMPVKETLDKEKQVVNLVNYPEAMHRPDEESCKDFNANVMTYLLQKKMGKNKTLMMNKLLDDTKQNDLKKIMASNFVFIKKVKLQVEKDKMAAHDLLHATKPKGALLDFFHSLSKYAR